VNIHDAHDQTHEHHGIWLQIPWYVNASLGQAERARVESHLSECAACRIELRQQRLIHRAMAADAGVDHISSGSLNRLRQRLDAAPGAQHQPPVATGPSRKQVLLAASIGFVAVALGALAVVSHRPQSSAGFPDNYHTVSTPTRRAPQEVIRAVFAPTITLAQLQRLLDESHLKIVAGPTEAGVYSLAETQLHPVGEVLTKLRQNQAVRFAEATGP
jgi:anti-sigma factor RsiW